MSKTGRITIIRTETKILDGRKTSEKTEYYRCWCDVQSLGTNERYTALQKGLENTIVFKVRNCQKMEEIRKNLKEFSAEYKGTEYKVYDASPMYTDERTVLLKCRIGD
ncbi:MAG: phage head closure protein [Lachnospiraceae bacterium]|nr:phage head closure protein [Lachnospiraceae bacterium]